MLPDIDEKELDAPLYSEDIKIEMISHTDEPVKTICTAYLTMLEADPMQALGELDYKAAMAMIEEIVNSRRGALEFVSFSFLAKGVSRALTHQLVRHRLWGFCQQSLRFFDASDAKFTIPDNIKQHGMEEEFLECCNNAVRNYIHFKETRNMPIEDARGLLPHATQTMIAFTVNFRALLDYFEQRLCLQAQLEHRQFAYGLKQCLETHFPDLAKFCINKCERDNKCPFDKAKSERECPKQKHFVSKG